MNPDRILEAYVRARQARFEHGVSATLAGKPFHFFLQAPYEADPWTESLLRIGAFGCHQN
jgi:hypothetical protein